MRREAALVRAIGALGHRLSWFSATSRRSNASLDFATVLPGVLDAARPLTGARSGLLTRVDDAARLPDSLFAGMRAREARLIHELDDGEQLIASVRGPR